MAKYNNIELRNLNKSLSDTAVRIGECRLSYVNVFAPRRNEDGTDGKYSIQLIIPKADKVAKQLIDAAVEAAVQNGISSKFGGKRPVPAKLKLPLRDGDEEFPDDDNYAGCYFMNASSSKDYKPGVRVLDNGQMVEALDSEDMYSGCFGCVALNFYAYSTSGNMGVAAGLNNVIKTRDGEKLGGTHSAESDFADLLGGDSCLD